MKETVRQHLVPRCYLKKFSLKRKKYWYIDAFDVQSQILPIFNVNVNSICVNSNFYTFDSLPNENKRFLETYYSKTIEADYSHIYEALISGNTISDNLRFKIISFIICQYLRTSKLTNVVNRGMSQVLTHGHKLIQYHNSPEKKIFFDGGGNVDFTNQSLEEAISASKTQNREYINLKNFYLFKEIVLKRMNDIISVSEVTNGEKLITSDNPVFSSGSIIDPSSIIKMPLNNKTYVTVIPFIEDDILRKKTIFRENLDAERSYIQASILNTVQIEQAEQFILGNEIDLEKAIQHVKNLDVKDLEARINKIATEIEERVASLKKA